jgi:hypothetical protein
LRDDATAAMQEGRGMNWGMFLKIGLAAVLVLLVNPAAGQNEKILSGERACKAAVRERLGRMRVNPNDVRSISIATRRRPSRHGGSKKGLGRSSSTSDGFDGWVRLKSCSGHIVVNLDRECRVKRVWSKGDCKAPK